MERKPIVCIAILLLTIAALMPTQARAQTAYTLTTLYSFNNTDGPNPGSSLIQGSDGLFYGTTKSGGSTGDGAVYKITASGSITTLYFFTGQDGNKPNDLMQAHDGNFYGTTFYGGAFGYGGGGSGCGTIFKLTPSGVATIVYSFKGEPDGDRPYSALFQASDGNFYSTTQFGGTYNKGTVFKMTPSGVVTILHSFSGGSDGEQPTAGVLEGGDGFLYGTTGGGNDPGTVFKISKTGQMTSIHVFKGPDGNGPNDLVMAADGTFFGTTADGGVKGDYGVIFKITPAGVITVLHSFGGDDGNGPRAGMVRGHDGYYYGSTFHGGANDKGTIFRISSDGEFLSVYSFSGSDGNAPLSGMLMTGDGTLYGTTFYGGANGYDNAGKGYGTVFKMTPK